MFVDLFVAVSQELRVEDAVAALEEAGHDVFQPALLLPLFPNVSPRLIQTAQDSRPERP